MTRSLAWLEVHQRIQYQDQHTEKDHHYVRLHIPTNHTSYDTFHGTRRYFVEALALWNFWGGNTWKYYEGSRPPVVQG